MKRASVLSLIVPGRVVRGHQVASGKNVDPRFPGGTLKMQVPFFCKHGLDLEGFHLATLNVSIEPRRYTVKQSCITLQKVAWHPTEPAEDFSFFDAAIRLEEDASDDDAWVRALIYYPHPETKPDHFQPPDMLEVLAEARISGIGYGTAVELALNPEQLEISEPK